MRQITDAEALSALLQKVKSTGGALSTNFFIDPGKLAYCFKEGLMFVEEVESGVLIFRKNDSFYHLYHYATSLEKLEWLLHNRLPKELLVTDVIGKEQQLSHFLQLFNTAGFKIRRQLDRYVRINKKEGEYYHAADDVTLAGGEDAAFISRLFNENFDKLSEQVPSLSEVEKLIEDKKILVVRDEQIVKGFLARDFNGQTTTLNNFLVDKQFRGEKIGSRLLKHYIFESKSTQRMILWVVSDNEVAIHAYRSHGYEKEALVDYVLINKL